MFRRKNDERNELSMAIKSTSIAAQPIAINNT
jgi:hypothetical protein